MFGLDGREATSGSSDNDTTAGWLSSERSRSERKSALRYLGTDGREAVWSVIRLVLSSVAGTAIVPMQDALGLGSEARMNTPASTENNWRWRMREDQLNPRLASKLREMNSIYGRGRKR